MGKEMFLPDFLPVTVISSSWAASSICAIFDVILALHEFYFKQLSASSRIVPLVQGWGRYPPALPCIPPQAVNFDRFPQASLNLACVSSVVLGMCLNGTHSRLIIRPCAGRIIMVSLADGRAACLR